VIINLDTIMLPGEDWMGDTIVNVNPAFYGGNAPDMGAYESPFTGPYSGPVWHVETTGSDSTGDGSEENPFASIQFGLDSANDEDTVLVASGMYVEHIIWPPTSGIKLIGSGEEDCVIDGDSTGRVLQIHDYDLDGDNYKDGFFDSSTVISGLTIQNGVAESNAGISLYYSDPTISNVVVQNNNAEQFGAGIGLSYSNPKLDNITIQGNRIEGYGMGDRNGAGIYCKHSSNPIITNSLITENIMIGGSGAGLVCRDSSNAILTNVIISNNAGTGLVCADGYNPQYIIHTSHPILTNVKIIGNSEGGIFCHSLSGPIMSNVTIAYNTKSSGYSEGAGIYSYNGIVTFDPVNRCNIYSNTIDDSSALGHDIAIAVGYDNIDTAFMDVILDTFSVSNPTDYYATPIDSFTFDILVGLDDLSSQDEFVPSEFALHPPYPNPFNPTTTIRFDLVETRHAVSLHVFDITGRVVETLVNGQIESGPHEIQWNAAQHASGIYFVEFVAGEKRDVQKLILLK
jgi:hypothetical protein